MWLVAHKRCWTADRLDKRGLPHHDRCLLCDQHEESIQHLLIGCVFARQFWFPLIQQVGLSALAPQPSDTSLDEWWSRAERVVTGDVKKGLNSIIILGSWIIWRHHDDCVFNGAAPNTRAALALAMEEVEWWSLEGAKGLTLLTARERG